MYVLLKVMLQKAIRFCFFLFRFQTKKNNKWNLANSSKIEIHNSVLFEYKFSVLTKDSLF